VRVAESAKTESQKGSELFGYVKAKAQSAAQSVAEAAANAAVEAMEPSENTQRSKSAPRRPQGRYAVRKMARKASKGGRREDVVAHAGNAVTPTLYDEADEREVKKLTDLGWSPVAARLALCQVEGGGAKAAHEWLADEANAEELLAAETAEIWAMEEAGRREKADKCCPEDYLAAEETVFEAQDDEEGRGLGMVQLRREMGHSESTTSSEVALVETQHRMPANDLPGLYSRKFQQDTETEEDEKPPVAVSPAASERTPMSDAPTQASAQEVESCSDEDEADEEDELPGMDSEDDELLAPEPPDGGSWEWPLSRNEKKARLNMVDRQMHALDKKALIQALIKERMVSRAGK